MWNTEAEKEALNEKIVNPQKNVQCPTCGVSLIEKQHGMTSYEILCPKCGINAVLRGI